MVVATGAYRTPKIPAFAAALDAGIVQLHSSAYRNVSQLRDGGVLVVGAGNSGAEIALEVARHEHPAWLSGRDTGEETPFRLGGPTDRLLTPAVWFLFSRVLTVRTPFGRALRRKMLSMGWPLVRIKAGGHRRGRDRARAANRRGTGWPAGARARARHGRGERRLVHRVPAGLSMDRTADLRRARSPGARTAAWRRPSPVSTSSARSSNTADFVAARRGGPRRRTASRGTSRRIGRRRLAAPSHRRPVRAGPAALHLSVLCRALSPALVDPVVVGDQMRPAPAGRPRRAARPPRRSGPARPRSGPARPATAPRSPGRAARRPGAGPVRVVVQRGEPGSRPARAPSPPPAARVPPAGRRRRWSRASACRPRARSTRPSRACASAAVRRSPAGVGGVDGALEARSPPASGRRACCYARPRLARCCASAPSEAEACGRGGGPAQCATASAYRCSACASAPSSPRRG